MSEQPKYRNVVGGIALLLSLSLAVYGADNPFAGKWKGELAAQPRGGATAGAPGAAPGTPGAGTESAPPAAPPAGGGGGGGRGGGFGGGGGRGGGFGGGGFGGFGGGDGPQKVTLNLKQSKDGKISGNITIGDNGNAEDVKEGRAVGNTITFKVGRESQTVYEYYGELKGEELVLTRNTSGGRGRPQEIILTRK